MACNFIKNYIQELTPYSTARDEFTGSASTFLDANENPYPSVVNRYPDPHQRALKRRIAELKKVAEECIFLGNGSDEAIDLLVRIVDCEGGGITITSPTYGMYKVAAANNGVSIVDAPLRGDFTLDVEAIAVASKSGSRLLFLCSPNNPTGQQYVLDDIRQVLAAFEGIVAVDEAYIDFADTSSALELLATCERLVVLQTFSKAWGMAGIRLGMAFAAPSIIQAMNKLKLPYNVSELTQRYALERLQEPERTRKEVAELRSERARVASELETLPGINRVFPSGGNFILVRMLDPRRIFENLQSRGIVVRDRSMERGCEGCLRVTIGTSEENDTLLDALREVL
ncbi:MAG: histidinol-phosphate transaminase [Pseudomonadota bacterium]